MAEFCCASRETWGEVLIMSFRMIAFAISAYIVTLPGTSL